MTELIIQIINYTLAMFMWLIAGRLLLSFFIKGRDNFILAFFIKFTEPIYKITGKLLPFAKESCIPPLSIIIIVAIRILLIVFYKAGIQHK